MYDGAKNRVQIVRGNLKHVFVLIGLQSGSTF